MIKLPFKLIERRDAQIDSYSSNIIAQMGYQTGYNQCFSDLMSEVRGLVLALQRADALFADDKKRTDVISEALAKWHAFCEVEKDEA